MEQRVMFCRPARCTGCRLCEMACSLALSGVCGREQSLIRILTHPRLGTSQPALLDQCNHTDELRCVQMCTAGALKFVGLSEWTRMSEDPEWVPVPVLLGLRED